MLIRLNPEWYICGDNSNTFICLISHKQLCRFMRENPIFVYDTFLIGSYHHDLIKNYTLIHFRSSQLHVAREKIQHDIFEILVDSIKEFVYTSGHFICDCIETKNITTIIPSSKMIDIPCDHFKENDKSCKNSNMGYIISRTEKSYVINYTMSFMNNSVNSIPYNFSMMESLIKLIAYRLPPNCAN